MKLHFFKEILTSRFISEGKAVEFEPLADNNGVLVLDPEVDKALVSDLTKAANEHRGGIVLIDEATYLEKKSLYPFNPQLPKRRIEPLKVAPEPPRTKVSGSEPGAADPVPSAKPPESAFKPLSLGEQATAPLQQQTAAVPSAPKTPQGQPPKPAFVPKTGKASEVLKPVEAAD